MKHKHHIIPRHIGGTDDPVNLVELSVEEHAEAHRKLFEEYGRKEDWLAWKALSGQIANQELQSHKSSLGGKTLKGRKRPKEVGEKIRKKLTGRKMSQETKDKISKSQKEKIEKNGSKHPWKGKRLKDVLNEDKYETFIHNCSKNSSFPDERNPFFGKKHTDETKQRISDTKKGFHKY